MHCKNYSHFFSKKFQNICVTLVNFNESLTNDVVSFEQLSQDTVFPYILVFASFLLNNLSEGSHYLTGVI